MGNAHKSLQIASVQLKHFRCFNQNTFELDSPIILMQGVNGTGKTSLLEALYYACYLRSFRTHLPRDLIHFDSDSFFVKINVHEYVLGSRLEHQIQAGFSGAKRLAKVNKQTVSSYKDLMQHYRVVSLTEDDLVLIKGSPQIRRTFIDRALLLADHEFITPLHNFRSVLDQRNTVLQHGSPNPDIYALWTQQLWEHSHVIQQARKQLIKSLEKEINMLLHEYFDNEYSIAFKYYARKESDQSFDEFWRKKDQLLCEELRYGRSLFGAHLDDVVITFAGKRSKSFASRGQQKLIVLLIKIAQIKLISAQKGPAIFLLDDFMTDFDQQRAATILSILVHLDNQLIFTSPTMDGPLEQLLSEQGAFYKKLTI